MCAQLFSELKIGGSVSHSEAAPFPQQLLLEWKSGTHSLVGWAATEMTSLIAPPKIEVRVAIRSASWVVTKSRDGTGRGRDIPGNA